MLQITGLHQSQGSSPWVLVWLVTNPVNPQGLCQRGWASFQRSQSSISSPTDPLGNPCPGTLWEILSFLVSTETLGSEPRASSFPPPAGNGKSRPRTALPSTSPAEFPDFLRVPGLLRIRITPVQFLSTAPGGFNHLCQTLTGL